MSIQLVLNKPSLWGYLYNWAVLGDLDRLNETYSKGDIKQGI